MTELISIVVPVYKVEKYLARCVDSIISQTYRNIEVILVDDGSPDGCGTICDQYAQMDSRIHVIHKENGGLSDARNCGVQVANGEYITFIDSDDYIAPNYIEYLYRLIKENDADISCCCYVKTSEDSVEFNTNSAMQDIQILSGKESCHALFGSLYLTLVIACGKLYKRDIVKKHPFPKGRKHEDEGTTCKYYYEADKVVICNVQLYAYYQNPTSITHTLGKGINHDLIWTHEQRALFFEEHNEPALTKDAWRLLFYQCVNGSIRSNGCYDEYLKTFGKGKILSKQVLYELKLYNISPKAYKLYRACRNVLGKIKRVMMHYGNK